MFGKKRHKTKEKDKKAVPGGRGPISMIRGLLGKSADGVPGVDKVTTIQVGGCTRLVQARMKVNYCKTSASTHCCHNRMRPMRMWTCLQHLFIQILITIRSNISVASMHATNICQYFNGKNLTCLI